MNTTPCLGNTTDNDIVMIVCIDGSCCVAWLQWSNHQTLQSDKVMQLSLLGHLTILIHVNTTKCWYNHWTISHSYNWSIKSRKLWRTCSLAFAQLTPFMCTCMRCTKHHDHRWDERHENQVSRKTDAAALLFLLLQLSLIFHCFLIAFVFANLFSYALRFLFCILNLAASPPFLPSFPPGIWFLLLMKLHFQPL